MDEEQQLPGGAVLRRARPGDETGILACIHALAEYEKEPDAVQTTAGDLRQALFASSPSVFAHVIEKERRIAAIAVWFLNYSTWTGRNGVYLEDLFVQEDERRHGYGRTLLATLARICAERGYSRARMVSPGLERALHPLLPLHRCRRHGWVDYSAPHRRRPDPAGRRLT